MNLRPVRSTAIVLLGAISAFAMVAEVRADKFLLKSGGRIEGTLLNPEQSPRQTYLVETGIGARIELDASLVRHVVPMSVEERWYQQWLPQMPDSLRGHWIMAEECRTRGLDDQREHHLRRVLEFDSDHEGARLGLGYNRVDGQWHQTDLWNRENGFVRYEGRWMLPQVVAIEKAKQAELDRQVEIASKIKLWRTWLVKQRGKQQEALQSLKAIRDPLAAPTLANYLEDDKELPQLKVLFIEILGQLDSAVALDALVERAMEDTHSNVREKALDQLAKKAPAPRAVSQLIGSLKDKDNAKVNRAAIALARLKDPTAIPALIDALVTEHKFQITTGGGPGAISPTFSNGPGGSGLGGLSMGGKPKIIKRDIQNNAVRDALVALTGGVNHQFNSEAWKHWYAQQNIPQEFNLRRPGE